MEANSTRKEREILEVNLEANNERESLKASMEANEERESLGKMLTHVSATSKCTIYRVHKLLRDQKPEAYEPQVIAIGPYHRGKDHLKMMEDHKLRYLRRLLQLKDESVDKYVNTMRPLEEEARKCYSEHISLGSDEFLNMLVLDGCFIVVLVMRCVGGRFYEVNDPLFCMQWILNCLCRDLVILENQLPFFVLLKLFDLIEIPDQHVRFVNRLSNFFKDLYPGQKGIDKVVAPPHSQINHLLDLVHRNWLPPNDRSGDRGVDRKYEEKGRYIDRATALSEANVTFKILDPAETVFDAQFDKGVILMPSLRIDDATECIFRNLIAYEQYFPHPPVDYIIDYVLFLDSLIDSPKDVEILSRQGIIRNWLGDDEVVAKIINSLLDSVSGPGIGFPYNVIVDKVDKHCGKRCNRWMAILRRKHLNSPWAIISIVAAVVLLLLTVTQTVFTILQVV